MSPEQVAALSEVSSKTVFEIQAETAVVWARRAWAAGVLAAQAQVSGDLTSFLTYSHAATEYGHEALEHAALCGDDRMLEKVRAIAAGF